jgi:hypothetical protein
MTPSPSTLDELFEPLIAWLDDGGDAETAIREYWRRRHLLLPKLNELDDEAMKIADPADSLTDLYDPTRAEWGYPVTEDQLRAGLTEIVASLRARGYLHGRSDA